MESGLPTGQLNPLAAAFKQAYGINVQIVSLSSLPFIQRATNDLKANIHEFDVANFGRSADPHSMVGAKYRHQSKPGRPERVPCGRRRTIPKVPLRASLAATTIGYNTKLVSAADAPKSWTDLTDPKWKGEIGIFDPSSGECWQPYEWLRETYGDSFPAKHSESRMSRTTAVARTKPRRSPQARSRSPQFCR